MSHSVKVKSVPIKSLTALRAAIQDLQSKGINITLEENAAPRMYYADQMQRQNGRKSEICPYVIRIPGSYYDIALVEEEDGSFTPVFDDYEHPPQGQYGSGGKKGIKSVLGQEWKGKVEHWAGARSDTEATLHSIGKLLQAYTVEAIKETAAAQGHYVESVIFGNNGEIHLQIQDNGTASGGW